MRSSDSGCFPTTRSSTMASRWTSRSGRRPPTVTTAPRTLSTNGPRRSRSASSPPGHGSIQAATEWSLMRWTSAPPASRHMKDGGSVPSADSALPTKERLDLCPRCSSSAIADAQSRHLVLPFTGSSAQSSEENARISDDTEDRERTPFTIITTVDVDPDDVRPDRAWRARNEDQPFGFEYAAATLRWLNLGHRDKPGDAVAVGGREDIRASRFETCRYCGVVQSVPETFGRTPPAEGFHRGWCLTRSSARNARVRLADPGPRASH